MHGANRRAGVHVLEAVGQRVFFRFCHQIGLGHEHLVRKTHLTACFLARVQLLIGVLGIDQRDDGVDQIGLGNLIIHEERLSHGAGISQTGGLNDDAVKVHQALAALGGQQLQGFAQVFADGAADAAIAHLQNLLFGLGLENVGVDVFLAELVLDHGNLHAVRLMQHALEQRGFARAQKAREDSDWNESHALKPLAEAAATCRCPKNTRTQLEQRAPVINSWGV